MAQQTYNYFSNVPEKLGKYIERSVREFYVLTNGSDKNLQFLLDSESDAFYGIDLLYKNFGFDITVNSKKDHVEWFSKEYNYVIDCKDEEVKKINLVFGIRTGNMNHRFEHETIVFMINNDIPNRDIADSIASTIGRNLKSILMVAAGTTADWLEDHQNFHAPWLREQFA